MNFPQPLFASPDAFVLRGLAALNRALDEAMPLTAARRRDLPHACRDLSAMLTSDRETLERPYWTLPRLTSAYLRYFLPWNLVRLTALLPGLSLGSAREGDGLPSEPLILDLGSGPCTLPLALWLSRPDLRRLPITVVASDTAPHPMDLGRRIFESLRRDLDPASPWTIRTLRAPAHAAIRLLRGRPWLIAMGNVLNELEERDRRPGLLLDRLETLVDDAARALPPGGRLLAVEPGTRQGGRLVSLLRGLALSDGSGPHDEDAMADGMEDGDYGNAWSEGGLAPSSGALAEEGEEKDGEEDAAPRFLPLAPCPHADRCPMTARGVAAWCHVNAPATAAPAALRDLSRLAGLGKESVSLSFLLLARTGGAATARENAGGRPGTPLPVDAGRRTARPLARLISDPFVLPGYPGRARYACTDQGLALIPDSAFLAPGALCEVTPTPRRDGKSGARLMTLPGREVPATRPPRPHPAGTAPRGEWPERDTLRAPDAKERKHAPQAPSGPRPEPGRPPKSWPRPQDGKNARPRHRGTGRQGAERGGGRA